MIDDKTLDSILYLSRLSVSEEEKDHFRTQVDDILDYFTLLNSYNTEGINPDLGEGIGVKDLREDTPVNGFTVNDIKTFAIHFTDNYFTVPKILDDFLENKEEE